MNKIDFIRIMLISVKRAMYEQLYKVCVTLLL